MRISKLDMTEWADTKAAEGQLPELIRRLIVASNPSLEEIIFPYGDSVGRSGHDGFVRVAMPKAYIVDVGSAWECGKKKDQHLCP